jgi:hypothetical protein
MKYLPATGALRTCDAASIAAGAAQTLLAYGHARSRTWLLDVARKLADQELLQYCFSLARSSASASRGANSMSAQAGLLFQPTTPRLSAAIISKTPLKPADHAVLSPYS